MIRIAVLVSGGGTNLQALIDSDLQHGKIELVVSSRSDAYALARAANAGIKGAVCRRKDYDDQDAYDQALIALLRENEIDMVVLAGFLSILGPAFIAAYPDKILNIHPSLIPSFCGKGYYGLRVHEAALERGVKVTGATVHLVNEIPDGGRIILQKAVAVQEGDTPEVLQRRVMEEAEWILLPKATEMLAEKLEEEKNASC